MNPRNFKATVTKGNNKGAGFIRFPAEIRAHFSIGDQYEAKIDNATKFYAKIRYYNGNGIFVPRDTSIKNKLCGKQVVVDLEKIDGFYSLVGEEGRVYIPNSYNVKDKDIILLKIIADTIEKEKFCKIYSRERNNTTEFFFYLESNYIGKEVITKLITVFPKNKLSYSESFLTEILKEFEFAEVGEERIIIFNGRMLPILINTKISLRELAHYLGCYFSDGTKRGNNWGICASTFEQANYYLKRHSEIIYDQRIFCSVTCTTYSGDHEQLKNNLALIWREHTRQNIEPRKIRIIKTNTEYASNRNPYGSLVIKENRQLTLMYYNRLLEILFSIIKEEHNKELATEFILGTMEGDGCVNSKTHGHIIITTNDAEVKILKEICDKSYFSKSSIRQWKGKKNRADLFIGSLELIKNMPYLKDKLFQYYPKRRKKLQERLASTGCARFLLKGTKTSNTLIGKLKENGILDNNNELTKFGKEVQASLRGFMEIV